MRIFAGLAFGLLLVAGFGHVGFAKRRAPAPVEPVVHQGIRYEAPGEKAGVVEAFEDGTATKLWEVQVYKVHLDPGLERDVQDVFITKLQIEGSDLLVTDERARQFCVDLTTHTVSQR